MNNTALNQKKELQQSDYAAAAMLVERASTGDRNALSELCDSIAKGVLYRVMYGISNPSDAEDVAQEVLIHVCQNIHKLSTPEAFRVWLGRIIIGETNRFFKRGSRNKEILDINDYIELVIEDRGTFLPAEYAENAEMRRAVINAITNLPPRQRQAVIFHYYDGLTVNDIAEAMGLTHQSVSVHLARARESIKSELKKKDHSVSFAKMHSISLGFFLFDIIKDDAAGFMMPSTEWLSSTLANCYEYIAAGTAAAAAVAATATAATTTATAASTAAGAAATAEAATLAATTAGAATTTTIATGWKIAAAALIAVCGIGAGALILSSEIPQATSAQPNQELASAAAANAITTQAAPTEAPTVTGNIAFSGGIDNGTDIVYVNPTHAEPVITSSGGAVTALEWWITEDNGINTVYAGTENEDLNNALTTLTENGNTGEYRLFYRLTCDSGAIYRICSNFYISTHEN